jgi:hypothetical protein
VKCWINKTIKLNDTWGPGANNVLRPPMSCLPEFSLRASYIRDSGGSRLTSQLRAEISSGFLSDGWHQAVFTPMGSVEVSGIYGLPPWDPSKAEIYRNMIQSPDNNLGDSRTLRLEGAIPYVGANGAVGYDTVRLFYAFNAVQGSPDADLVIVKIATLAAIPGIVQARQDGGGQGPPH